MHFTGCVDRSPTKDQQWWYQFQFDEQVKAVGSTVGRIPLCGLHSSAIENLQDA